MYANLTIKSTSNVEYKHRFSITVTLEAPGNGTDLVDFVERLKTLNRRLRPFRLQVEVTSVSQGSTARDGSEDGQRKRRVDEARLAQYILEQGMLGPLLDNEEE